MTTRKSWYAIGAATRRRCGRGQAVAVEWKSHYIADPSFVDAVGAYMLDVLQDAKAALAL